jgi:hypothetical protein
MNLLKPTRKNSGWADVLLNVIFVAIVLAALIALIYVFAHW